MKTKVKTKTKKQVVKELNALVSRKATKSSSSKSEKGKKYKNKKVK